MSGSSNCTNSKRRRIRRGICYMKTSEKEVCSRQRQYNLHLQNKSFGFLFWHKNISTPFHKFWECHLYHFFPNPSIRRKRLKWFDHIKRMKKENYYTWKWREKDILVDHEHDGIDQIVVDFNREMFGKKRSGRIEQNGGYFGINSLKRRFWCDQWWKSYHGYTRKIV